MRSKASLGSSREVARGCGVSFVNYLYLVPLIIGQNFYATCTTHNQTRPEEGGFGLDCRDAFRISNRLCVAGSALVFVKIIFVFCAILRVEEHH